MSNRGVSPFAVTHMVRDTCMCLSVHRAARALARRYDDALRPARLTNGQFSLLMSLNRAEAPSIGSVATLLVMDRTTLTANLKPLVRRKLVKVMIDPTDKRGRRLVLTSAGRVALITALPLWRKEQARSERLIGGPNPALLRADLRALS
jgi:DNA-binding MarR family transcriptional regulator